MHTMVDIATATAYRLAICSDCQRHGTLCVEHRGALLSDPWKRAQ